MGRRTFVNAPRGQALSELLPADLDALASPTILSALGVQLLLFGGFEPNATGWRRGRPPASLKERVDLVTPTWKKPLGRGVDYGWPGDASISANYTDRRRWALPLFAAADELRRSSALTTVHSLSLALEGVGLSASDFDDDARAALREMMAWRMPGAERVALSSAGDLTLLIFSFDGAKPGGCSSVLDCAQPGPANELLAATAEAFVRRRAREHGQRVTVVAQWEVAAALRALSSGDGLGDEGRDVVAVGTPGLFENTARIYEHMLPHLQARGACDAADASASAPSSRLVLLTHPDHLRRALRIGETAFARAGSSPCRRLRPVPALQPYRLDWPLRSPASDEGAATGSVLDLYAGVSGSVQTGGTRREVAWHDAPYGFFADGSQPWVYRREVWICCASPGLAPAPSVCCVLPPRPTLLPLLAFTHRGIDGSRRCCGR